MVAENQAVLICSIEAKTEDAVQEMNAVDERGNSTFTGIDFLNFGCTDHDKASCYSWGSFSLGKGKFDTENKKYYVLQSNSIENEERVDFYISTDRIKDIPKIIIPMDCNIETKTTALDGDINIKYNPISIYVTLPVTDKAADCDKCYWNGTYFYFRMKNGEVKTFTQLYSFNSVDFSNDENGNEISRTISAWARGVIEPDEIKSIIVNDIEYPVDDPSDPKPITIDEHMKPFIINPYVKGHLWLPLRDFCNGIGATIEWNDETRSAEVKYRGSTYVFTVGGTQVQINGETVDFYNELYDDTTFIDEYGRMIVTPSISAYMDIDIHGINLYDENGSVNKNALLHIIP